MKAISLTPEGLQALISQGEGQRLELKRSLAELETGVRSVAAMANSDGGHVLFGIRDDGRVTSTGSVQVWAWRSVLRPGSGWSRLSPTTLRSQDTRLLAPAAGSVS